MRQSCKIPNPIVSVNIMSQLLPYTIAFIYVHFQVKPYVQIGIELCNSALQAACWCSFLFQRARFSFIIGVSNVITYFDSFMCYIASRKGASHTVFVQFLPKITLAALVSDLPFDSILSRFLRNSRCWFSIVLKFVFVSVIYQEFIDCLRCSICLKWRN